MGEVSNRDFVSREVGAERDGRVQKGEATRLKLVAIATKLFARDGFEATTIETVLAAAGISRGALYHHFGGKEELFEAVFVAVERDVMARVGAATESETTAPGALAAGCKAWLRLAADPVIRRVLLIDAPAALGWNRWRELDEIYALGLLRAGVRQLALESGIADDLVDSFAHVLLAAANELALLVANAADSELALDRANRTLDLLLGSLLGQADGDQRLAEGSARLDWFRACRGLVPRSLRDPRRPLDL